MPNKSIFHTQLNSTQTYNDTQILTMSKGLPKKLVKKNRKSIDILVPCQYEDGCITMRPIRCHQDDVAGSILYRSLVKR